MIKQVDQFIRYYLLQLMVMEYFDKVIINKMDQLLVIRVIRVIK